MTSSVRQPALLPAKPILCKPEDQILEGTYFEMEIWDTVRHLCGGFVTLQTVYTRDVFTYFDLTLPKPAVLDLLLMNGKPI